MQKNGNIGLGTAAIGRPLYINVRQENPEAFSLPRFRESGLQVLEDAYGKGIRFFDTAPGYGIAEELLVAWLAKKNDPTIRASTKWGYTYVADFNPNAMTHEVKEHSVDKLMQQWEFSKMLLPYLKIYQIHSATLDTGVLNNQGILKLLHQIKKEHNIIIGLATTGSNQVEVINKALSIAIENEKLFQSFQCTFNILDQSILALKNTLSNANVEFIIKEALANGRLIPNKLFNRYQKLYNFLMTLAVKYKVGVDAIALRYCIDCFPNAIVLSGAKNCTHLSANLKAQQFSLNQAEIEQLRSMNIHSRDYWEERAQLSWN
ncbi:aldo/keto reductase [Maribacter sp. 2308TA10-17]|uniref:aldo/keto reductase n=1 Tax=Maribacter sp. 2308TA10-17 TaxID=3386276 RepID=UPI0039BC7E95